MHSNINCFLKCVINDFLLCVIHIIVNPSAINTIRVGRIDDPTTPITITPTLSQPVKLECERTGIFKQWYTDGTAVTTTSGDLTTTAGAIRTLSISSFSPSHAKGYTCTVSATYPVILGEWYNIELYVLYIIV